MTELYILLAIIVVVWTLRSLRKLADEVDELMPEKHYLWYVQSPTDLSKYPLCEWETWAIVFPTKEAAEAAAEAEGDGSRAFPVEKEPHSVL